MICLLSFASTHHAMAAERHCEKQCPCRLIPLPPKIDAGCGLVLRLEEESLPIALQVLTEKNIPYQGKYRQSDGNTYEVLL